MAAALVAIGLGGPPAQALPATVRDAAVDAVAAYVPSSQRLDAALESAGYSPPIAPTSEVMSHLPDVRKLEAAYFAAEQARPNRGGAELLAYIRNEFAQHAPAILQEEVLLFLHKRLPMPPLPFVLAPTLPVSKPPSPIWESIASLSNYGASGLGSHQQTLVRHFQYSNEAAYELLRNNSTFAEALQRAYQASGSNGIKNLRSFAKAVASVSPAIRYDHQVAAIFPGSAFPTETVAKPKTDFGMRPKPGSPAGHPKGPPPKPPWRWPKVPKWLPKHR